MVVARGFGKTARSAGSTRSVRSLGVAEFPGVFESYRELTPGEAKRKTEEHLLPQITMALTTPAEEKEEAEDRAPRDVVFRGSASEVNSFFSDRTWSDGLPVVPPTLEAVEEFLRFTDREPHETIAVLPRAGLAATPWNVAVNGVMAGCRPEHMPILIAMVEAIGDPAFNLDMLGTTGAAHPFLIVNGPFARQLGISSGQGLISHPTNQVIGRALGLVVRNIAGFRIGESYMGTFGYVQPWVLAEDEEESPWDPYHVRLGFDKNASTVTAYASTSWGPQVVPSPSPTKGVMEALAYDLAVKSPGAAHPRPSSSIGESVDETIPYRAILITSASARLFADSGYATVDDLVDDLVSHARAGLFEAAHRQTYACGASQVPASLEEAVERYRADPRMRSVALPWYQDVVETLPTVSKDKLVVIVCGDRGKTKMLTMGNFPYYQAPVTKEIKLPEIGMR